MQPPDNRDTYKTPQDLTNQRIEEALISRELDISYLDFDIFVANISKLSKIKSLNLSHLGITELPKEIGLLSELKELDLSGNKLTLFPPELGKLYNLTDLDLHHNQLRKLTKEIGELINLEILDLSNNQIIHIPSEITNLTKLGILDLRKNPILVSTSILENVHDPQSIIKHYLEEIVPSLLENRPSSLQFLDFSDRDIDTLPFNIIKFPNLTVINLSNNRLISIPLEITQLTGLISLDLSNNRISTLPVEISNLRKLEYLDLKENPINIPSALLAKQQKPWSVIAYYFMTSLKDELGKISYLTHLDFSGCGLINLPKEIEHFTNLEFLDLRGCQLTSLPVEIKQLMKLTFLDIEDNPLQIPPEILEKKNNPQAIIAYLVISKKKPLNEIKLIVVGQGSVGKTSIIRRLLNNTYDPIENKTEGIDIHRIRFRDTEPSYTINLWDFGGQEIMHATHQFFLTKRSLYLLVLDARLTQEENRVEYWLKIIQSFGGESPVLIVGNKIDQHPLDIDRTGLQKKYPDVVKILEASAATGHGIDIIRKEIEKQIDILPHVHDLLPEVWFTIKKKLEDIGQKSNFIIHADYEKLCKENDVGDEISQRTLIGFLHDLGVVLHFQDDPRLEALGILNPQWVTNGVYKILNSHELFLNQGTLTLTILNNILNTQEYPKDKRLFIVDMMKKFELCYDIEADKSFLIPDLLPKDEPYTGDWDDALAFQIHYNVLPSSIISRFIVRMNAFFHKTVWRSGIILKSSGNTALVKADTEDRKIFIWVKGDENTRRDFLSAIRMEFEAIHKTIAKIETTEKVPIPFLPQIAPVDYEFLLRLEGVGRTTFPTQAENRIVDIDVKQILDGITTLDQRHAESTTNDRLQTISTFATSLPKSVPTTKRRPIFKPRRKFDKLLGEVLSLPKYIGRFIFDLFGRHNSADSSSNILGWILVIIAILVMRGIINIDDIARFFTSIWHFFNTTK
jgi:internalin A